VNAINVFSGGCASFGHSCFGGHGKRAEFAPDGSPALSIRTDSFPALDPVEYHTMMLFKQLCTLQPEQYLRLAPVFRKMVVIPRLSPDLG